MTATPSPRSAAAAFRGERLRELREQQGLDVAILARRLSLSAAQLRQLEENKSSLFYSEAIRLAAARKVSEFLGEPLLLEPPLTSVVVDEVEGPPAAGQAEEAADLPLSAQPPLAVEHVDRLAGSAIGSSPSTVKSVLFAWVALLGAGVTLALLLFVQSGSSGQMPAPMTPGLTTSPDTPHKAQVPPSAPLVTNAGPAEQAVSARAEEPVPLVGPARPQPLSLAQLNATEGTEVAACGSFTGPVANFSPSQPVKDGSLVYVVGSADHVVCLKDGQGKVARHVFNEAAGKSFYGTAPWLVESSQLATLQIFFQGARVRLNEAGSQRLRLIAAEPLKALGRQPDL